MPIGRPGMYLPLSEGCVERLLCGQNDLLQSLYGLSLPQYTALLLIARLPEKNSQLEQFFASALEIGNSHVEEVGLKSYIDSSHTLLSKSTIRCGLDLLEKYKVTLLDDDAVRLREYLKPDGSWDFEFNTTQSRKLNDEAVKVQIPKSNISYLTAEQSRLYREFESQSDEQIHVQGYAGTGKSTFIVAILKMLEKSNAQVLLLAHTKKQLDALSEKANLSTSVHKNSFIGLAQKILPDDQTDQSHRNFRRIDSSRATMPDAQLIKLLGIRDSGNFSSVELVGAVRGTLYGFCQSDSNEISEEHLPHRYRVTLDDATSAACCQHARALWTLFKTPSMGPNKPQVRGYHVIKWAALSGCKIPAIYTHVLLDESHNLSDSVLQILKNSPQALLTLGDEYQRLRGRSVQLPDNVRKRELSHSVRSSRELEGIVNPIISVHPGVSKSPFHGNRNSRIEIEYYEVAKVPSQSAVILVSEMWGLFEWAQRIAAQNTNIQLLSDIRDLNMFVQDCIELYNTGSRPRHPELFRFGSWNDVAKYHRHSRGFQRIDRMLEKGFGYKDWQQTQGKITASKIINVGHVDNSGRSSLALDLIKNTVNHEFDNVMLAPGIFRGSVAEKHTEFCSSLYICVTRAKKKLTVPVALRSWIEEVSAS